MKKLLTTLTMALALGAGAALTTVQAQDYWDDYDVGFWQSNEWGTDDYGYYDDDFSWETTDEDWDSWYGDADADWDTYDDAGEGGWFDV